ncbi:hypothetical protein Ciccas_007058 [Cichlidogyrus casuarinus]|uniref:Uncharacterized protein n=1 Tax=Cichlidogyrus casuarinus TaxID=1844966 RepID=A0ABD2Q3Y9_9PLAT
MPIDPVLSKESDFSKGSSANVAVRSLKSQQQQSPSCWPNGGLQVPCAKFTMSHSSDASIGLNPSSQGKPDFRSLRNTYLHVHNSESDWESSGESLCHSHDESASFSLSGENFDRLPQTTEISSSSSNSSESGDFSLASNASGEFVLAFNSHERAISSSSSEAWSLNKSQSVAGLKNPFVSPQSSLEDLVSLDAFDLLDLQSTSSLQIRPLLSTTLHWLKDIRVSVIQAKSSLVLVRLLMSFALQRMVRLTVFHLGNVPQL